MPGFLKTYPDGATAREALRRSDALRLAGLSTPQARQTQQIETLSYDWIKGDSGIAVLMGDLGDLFDSFARLQQLRLPGLPPFDPLQRTRPRLPLLTSGIIRSVVDEPVPHGTALVHGDLHVGQFIRDRTGTVWIIDLDDLALGLPEADLANFCAHVATSGTRQDFATTLTRICAQVIQAWTHKGRRCDGDVFARFLRFALVRRHLKLRQAGRPDFEPQISGFLATGARRIFPSDSAAYPG